MTTNQKDVVRALVLQHGQKIASELSEVPYETVRKWTQRGNWLSQNVPKHVATTVADNVQSELAKLESETRTSLARSAARMSREAEKAELKRSGEVHNVAKTAAIVHRWDAKTDQSQNVVVNVALLGVQPSEVQATVLDVDPGVSE